MTEGFLEKIGELMEASSKSVEATEQAVRRMFNCSGGSDETAVLLLQLEVQAKQLAVATAILAALTYGKGEPCESSES